MLDPLGHLVAARLDAAGLGAGIAAVRVRRDHGLAGDLWPSLPLRRDRPITRQGPVSYTEAGSRRIGLPLRSLRANNLRRRVWSSAGLHQF